MATSSGNWDRVLRGWVEGLEDVQDLKPLSRTMARETQDLMRAGFKRGQDPWGRAWKPKKEPDGRKPLTGETARLSKPWPVTVGNTWFKLTAPVEYAQYHQNGSKGGQEIAPKNKKMLRFKMAGKIIFTKGPVKRGDIPKRKMYPDGNDIPPKWEEAYRDSFEDFCDRHLGK